MLYEILSHVRHTLCLDRAGPRLWNDLLLPGIRYRLQFLPQYRRSPTIISLMWSYVAYLGDHHLYFHSSLKATFSAVARPAAEGALYQV